MNTRFGIDVVLNSAAAIGGLNRLGQQLGGFGAGPARTANAALSAFGQTSAHVTGTLEGGLNDAGNAWSRLAGAFGAPVTLGGIWAAVSGITSLKEVIIGANAQLETAQNRMAGTMRNWNDTAGSAMLKSKELMTQLRQYAKETPFESIPLVNAAAIAAQQSRTAGGVMDIVKLSSRLAAYKGTNDPTWSTQAIVSAMQGNFASLQESFGITATKEQVEGLAATTKYGRTARGRYEALKRLIEMRVGKEGPDDVVKLLAKTGAGVTSTLKDQFAFPITDAATAGYNEAVKGLVRFSERLEVFQQSTGFKDFQSLMSEQFVRVGRAFNYVLDGIGTNLTKLPALAERFGPSLRPFLIAAGVVVGVNASVLALRGSLGLLAVSARLLSGVMLPFLAVVLNPLVLGALVAVTAGLYPLVRDLNLGGQTVEQRWKGVVNAVTRTDWRAVFAAPLAALRDFLARLSGSGGSGGAGLLSGLLGDRSEFVNDLRDMAAAVRIGFVQALTDTFPGAQAAVSRLQGALASLKAFLAGVGVDWQRFALAFGALGLAARAAGISNPLFAALGGALRGVSAALAAFQILIASPVLAVALLALGGLLSPLTRNLQIGGRAVGDYFTVIESRVAGVDWARLFGVPLAWVRSLAERLSGSGFSFTAWFREAFAPGSILAFLGGLTRPIWAGLLRALDGVFPEAQGWFRRTFGNAGTVITEAFGTVLNVLGPLLDGFFKTVGPTLRVIGASLAPLVGLAWGALAGAVHALSEFVKTPVGQGTLRLLGMLAGIVLPLMAVGRILGPVAGGLLSVGRAGVAGFAAARGAGAAFIGFVRAVLTFPGGVIAAFQVMGRAVASALAVRFPLLGHLARILPVVGRFALVAGRALLVFGRALLIGMGPVGWAIGIVLALAQAGVWLYNNWEPFRTLMDAVGDQTRLAFRGMLIAGRAFMAWAAGVPAAMGEAWDGAMDRLYAFGVRVKGAFTGIVKGSVAFGSQVYEAVTGAVGRIPEFFAGVVRGMADTLTGWVKDIPGLLTSMTDNLPAPLKTLISWVQAHMPGGSEGGGAGADLLPGDVGGGAPAPGYVPPIDPLAALYGAGVTAPGGAASVSLNAPMTMMNAAGMSPEEIEAMVNRNLRALLPLMLDKAVNGVRS